MEERFELLRDVAEHNAMFMNPEGVQQVRDTRDNSFETPEEDFNKLLEDMFGRNPHLEKKEQKYSSIIDMDLDEVLFTPFER